MTLMKKRHGVQKVSFWVVILLTLITITGGVRLGVWMSGGLAVSETVSVSLKSMGKQILEHFIKVFTGEYSKNQTAFYTELVISVIVAAVLVYLFYKHLPQRRKAFDIEQLPLLEQFQLLLYMVAAVAGFMTGKNSKSEATIVSVELGILTVAAVIQLVKVLQDVYLKPNSKDYAYFEQNKKSVLMKTTLIGIMLVGLPLWIPDFWGFQLPQVLQDRDLLGYYTALLSLTFISISVMSVLSDRTVVIYWENIAEGKLIKPVFGSFAAYTYYSLGAAVGAGVCVALNNGTAFVVFGVINIVTMILLTYTMVDVYYDRESKKLRREKELQVDEADYRWVKEEERLSADERKTHHIKDSKSGEAYTEREIEDKYIGYSRYLDKMLRLCQNIHRANDEHDLIYLQEVHELYQRNLRCFNNPEGKRVVHMLFSDCTAQSWPLLLGSLKAHMETMTQTQTRDSDPFATATGAANRWNQDEQLWAALTESAYLREWLRSVSKDFLDTQELSEFILLVIRRLVVFYNHMLTHHHLTNPGSRYEYLQATLSGNGICVRTESGEQPDTAQMTAVFSETFVRLMTETTFVTRLLRVLCVMLENLDRKILPDLSSILAEVPILRQFTPYLHTLGFSQQQIALWETHFSIGENK